MSDFKITYVSHASIRIDGAFGSLLTDPWILNEPVYDFSTWKFPAAVIPPSRLTDVDYLYISHAHEDHFHIPSLDLFPRDVKIVLPEYTWHPGLRAQTMERVLREMGFYNIVKMPPWTSIDLDERTRFTMLPSSPTKPQDWENSGFILEHPDCRMINMNDCPADADIYRRIDAEYGEFDIGFVQYAGVSMFPGCYRMPIEEMREVASKRKHAFTAQRLMLDGLRLKKVAPFAGDFCWLSERMLHCNWSNRATPKLFSDFVTESYPHLDVEVLIMNPSDCWSPGAGVTRNHPEIDWDRYLDAIGEVRRKFQPKVEAIEAWIEDSDRRDMETRSRAYTAQVQRWITKDEIDFTGCFRFVIEGDNAGFSFLLKADPKDGFRILWDEDESAHDIDQTLYLREAIWAALLDGKVMWNMLQWQGENVQHVPFRPELGRFWFWLEVHSDLNNRNSQAMVDRAQHPELAERIRPKLGVFELDDEWDLPWMRHETMPA